MNRGGSGDETRRGKTLPVFDLPAIEMWQGVNLLAAHIDTANRISSAPPLPAINKAAARPPGLDVSFGGITTGTATSLSQGGGLASEKI